MQKPITVVIGAGFAGLEAAQKLDTKKTDVIIIDRQNHHLFQPLLYQVATGALAEASIAEPLRNIFSTNYKVIMGEVVAINKETQLVVLDDGKEIHFDNLLIAPGAKNNYFGNDSWEHFSHGIKTLDDAIYLREHLFASFERAEKAASLEDKKKYLTFCIIGAGPTGVELAGSMGEIARSQISKRFSTIDNNDITVYLIEGMGQVLPGFPEKLSIRAKRDLEKLGVTVMTNTFVQSITEEGISCAGISIKTVNVIWAAGNLASPLIKTLNIPLDRQGRGIVEKDLSIQGYPNIFILGDAACCMNGQGIPLPALAPVAKQQGKFVANIINTQTPFEKRKPFKYFDKGSLATIGRGKAVGLIGKIPLTGFIAWFGWCFIHILYLIGFRNKLQLLIEWGFLYTMNKRSLQLIIKTLKDMP